MKKTVIIFSLSILMLFSFSAFAAANDSYVIYHQNSGDVEIGMGTSYGTTDLFGEFKNVMPGDELTQKITLSYDGSSLYKARIYLRCLDCDASNKAFLEKLRLSVTVDGSYVFDETADYSTGLEYLHLATLEKGETRDMYVTLTVPTDLDNSFEEKIGKVEWEFAVEEIPQGGYIIIPSIKDKVSYKVVANYYTDGVLVNPMPLTLFAYRFAEKLPTLEEVVMQYSDAHTKYGDHTYSFTGIELDGEKNVFILRYDRKTEPVIPTVYYKYSVIAKYFTNGALDGTSTLFLSSDVAVLPKKEEIADAYAKYNEYLGKEYEYRDISFYGENNTYTLTFERDYTHVPPPTGDNSHLSLWISLLISAIAVIFILILLMKKKDKNRK